MRVRIEPAGDAEAGLWRTALEIASLFADLPWVIIGAQMLMLLEHEHGRPSGRTTQDPDAIVDVRALAGGIGVAARRLAAAGFEAAIGHPHRFIRAADQVDLLAPDHLGPRADLTTIAPLVTVSIPGGTRALATRRLLEVDVVDVGSGTLPVPSTAGAFVLKTRAWQARRAPRDLEDLVRLLDLVADVEGVRAELTPSERRRFGAVAPLADARGAAWRVARDPANARAAWVRLVD